MRSLVTLAFLMLLASLGPAQATGGFWCDIEDQNLKFHVKAAYPRSGGHLFGLESTLQVFDKPAPKEFRAFRFKPDDLIAHWLDSREGGSLKLRFLRRGSAKQSFADVSLTIDAPAIEEATFKGRYALTIQPKKATGRTDPFEAGGSVSCSAD